MLPLQQYIHRSALYSFTLERITRLTAEALSLRKMTEKVQNTESNGPSVTNCMMSVRLYQSRQLPRVFSEGLWPSSE